MFNPNVVLKKSIQSNSVQAVLSLLARVLMAYIFIVAGWGKVTDYASTVGYMEAMGVSGQLLPLTIFAELGGGLAILLGFQTRLAALGLAVFSLLTALLFHGAAADAVNFMKNLAMMGGFLLLLQHGAGKISLDHLLEK